ncbi:nucleotidyltransferase family protein [Microbacterium sp. LWH3-1.2]|uniref:nucleotidyltransferase family protein n=1 Tax=Microbacterium sp. LWH3-1.2 TaxID=3135256 RepID=UPI00342F39FB
MRVCGIVLAAGAGSRYGRPKGLVRSPDGSPWVARATAMLRAGGCDEVVVVVGARGREVALLAPDDARVVVAPDWAVGLSAALRAGLEAVADGDVAVVTPVDTPDAAPQAVARVLSFLGPVPRDGLAQAVYGGRPGHPVAIGANHLPSMIRSLTGDRGARAYLAGHGAVEVECADLWSGADIDVR